MEPRERLEHRAERAIVRVPLALAGVIVTVLVQLAAGIWFAAQFVARNEHTERALSKIELKVDSLLAERITARDLEPIRSLLADHETRLRNIEARPR